MGTSAQNEETMNSQLQEMTDSAQAEYKRARSRGNRPQLIEPVINNSLWTDEYDSAIKIRDDNDTITYRDIAFKAKDLIDMRGLIHQKIEQVLERASLWRNIMPSKIFRDLVSFNAEVSGQEFKSVKSLIPHNHTKSIDGLESVLSSANMSAIDYRVKTQTQMPQLVSQLYPMRPV